VTGKRKKEEGKRKKEKGKRNHPGSVMSSHGMISLPFGEGQGRGRYKEKGKKRTPV
jgi:hypothetical protein